MTQKPPSGQKKIDMKILDCACSIIYQAVIFIAGLAVILVYLRSGTSYPTHGRKTFLSFSRPQLSKQQIYGPRRYRLSIVFRIWSTTVRFQRRNYRWLMKSHHWCGATRRKRRGNRVRPVHANGMRRRSKTMTLIVLRKVSRYLFTIDYNTTLKYFPKVLLVGVSEGVRLISSCCCSAEQLIFLLMSSPCFR
jgi:hypothetical protein